MGMPRSRLHVVMYWLARPPVSVTDTWVRCVYVTRDESIATWRHAGHDAPLRFTRQRGA